MENDIVDRIRKMLALAENNNSPEEAAQAAAMAARLMEKHQIEEATVRAESKAEAEGIDENFEADASQKSVVPWKGVVMSGLASTMGFKYWWQRGKVCTLKLYGRQSAVRGATYMYEYLVNEINQLAELQPETGRAFRNAFRFGAAVTIRERLVEAKKMAEEEMKLAAEMSGSTALMVIGNDRKELEVAYDKFKKKAGIRAGRRATVTSMGGFETGKAAGRTISLGGARPQLGASAARLGAVR